MAMRKMFIESKGGLGNQLFSYFYGIFLANSTAVTIEIVTVDKHHENSNLDSIKFMGSGLRIPKVTKSRWRIYLVKLHIFFDRNRKKFSRRSLLDRYKVESLKVSSSLPFDSRVTTGYFADFSFYDSLDISGSNISILKPSVQYLNKFSVFEKRNFIAFHIRYGDFLISDMSNSVLDPEFYLDALKVIDDEVRKALDIVVFCDQPELLDQTFISNKRISVFDSEGLSALEVIKIMSCANAFVLCLSTFGFWSAKLSVNDPKVVYPSCNIAGEMFIEGIPSSWVAQDPPWKVKNFESPE